MISQANHVPRPARPGITAAVSLKSLATLCNVGTILVLSSTFVLQYASTIVFLHYSTLVLQYVCTIVFPYHSTFVLQYVCTIVRLYHSTFVL
jgi:hypothetical protein